MKRQELIPKTLKIKIANKVIEIANGERIAQLVISKYEKIDWEDVKVLDKTERGAGGFGSTGVK